METVISRKISGRAVKNVSSGQPEIPECCFGTTVSGFHPQFGNRETAPKGSRDPPLGVARASGFQIQETVWKPWKPLYVERYF